MDIELRVRTNQCKEALKWLYWLWLTRGEKFPKLIYTASTAEFKEWEKDNSHLWLTPKLDYRDSFRDCHWVAYSFKC
jgi:hypothetical protein